jgi:hypothetical protein
MSYIGKEPIVGNFQVCDAITVVNGQAAYTLQVSSTNVTPESSHHMLVSLNGILQKNGGTSPSFTVSGSTLTFASNLATGDVIDFVILLGNVLDLGTPSDGTVTNAKLAQDIISGETELADAPASTDEILISDAGTLKRIDVADLGSSPNFEAYLSANQSISDATLTKVAFNTERFDSDSAYDNSTNYRFTVPTGKDGKYFVYSNVQVTSSADSLASGYIMIKKNGSEYMRNAFNPENSSMGYLTPTIAATMDLSATDYIEIFGLASLASGSPSFGTGTQSTFFGAYRLLT